MIFKGNSKISGVGSYIPNTSISSVDLLEELHTERRFGMHSTWMDKTLGIKSRRYCEDNERPSDIASIAALKAIEDAGIDVADIDAIIYCGITGDFIEPGTAHIIQHKIGATNAICKDVANACHGFCDGLLFADLMIGSGIENALVVTAELTRVSRLAFPVLEKEKDRDKFLYTLGVLTVGDAAGAMVLSKKHNVNQGIHIFNTVSDGKFNDLCNYNITDGKFDGGMVMDKISYITMRQCAKQLPKTLNVLNKDSKKISHFIMHQVGKTPYKVMTSIVSKALQYVPACIPKTFEELGNITTVTLPLNLDLLKKSGKMQEGDKVILLGTGSGIVLTWIGLTL